MLSMIIGTKKGVQGKIDGLEGMMRSCSSCPKIVQALFYIVASFGKFLIEVINFVIAIPIFFFYSPQQSFEKLARRKDDGQFIDSYTTHMKRYRFVVGTSLCAVLAIAIQLSIFGLVLYHSGKPTTAEAYTTSTTVTATYDITSRVNLSDIYSCESSTATTLAVGGDMTYWNVANIQFSLSGFPSNITVTKVEFIGYVASAMAANDTSIYRGTDEMPSLTCEEKYNNATVLYTDVNWNSTGLKTVDLGSTAVSDVQARLTDVGVITLDIVSKASLTKGTINSANNASNKPQLKVTYILAPQAPTGFAKGDITTSSIVWNWTDNASADTGNVIHDASHVVKCTTGDVEGIGSTGSCEETGLSANTQYTRHANVIDADANTDSAVASAYTAIETPSGIATDSVSGTAMTVHASGTISNLGQGQSALLFADSSTGRDSGWVTTNSWTESGLAEDSVHAITVTARNGDGVETSATAPEQLITLASIPDVASTRSTSTWYQTGSFAFTNSNGWDSEGGTVHFYRYVWSQSATHAFDGSEDTWNNIWDGCPGDSCTVEDETLTVSANADGQWYLHLLSYNGAFVATGTGSTFGPYWYDHTAPAAPSHVYDGTGADVTYTASSTQLSANWGSVTDANSGLQKYQYAIGTTSGGTNVVNWTDNGTATSVTKTGLTLTNDTTYYLSIRAMDNANNIGAVTTSNGITVDADQPSSPQPVVVRGSYATPTRYYISDTDTIEVEWSSVDDVQTYQYAIGTTPGGDDVVGYTDDGVGTTLTQTGLDLANGGEYYVSVRAVDTAGNTSETATSNPVVVDTIAPEAPPAVNDGTGTDAAHTTNLTSLSANWTAVTDASSGIQTYQYAIGTTTGGTDVVNWTDNTTSTSVTVSGLSLTNGTTYYVSVRAVDNAGNIGTAATSNGITVVAVQTPSETPPQTPSTAAPSITDARVIAGETIATFYWTTDEPATSKVDCGGGYTKSSVTMTESHRVQIAGFYPGASYGCVLTSGDATYPVSFITATSAATTNRAIGPTILELTPQSGTLTATGVAKGDQTIRAYIDGTIVKTVTTKAPSSETRSFSITIPLSSFKKGTHTLYLQSTDQNGRTSIIRQRVTFTVQSGGTDATIGTTTGTPLTYTVKQGDSLWRIAQRYLGGGSRYVDIVEVNKNTYPEVAVNPSMIRQGMVLILPAE